MIAIASIRILGMIAMGISWIIYRNGPNRHIRVPLNTTPGIVVRVVRGGEDAVRVSGGGGIIEVDLLAGDAILVGTTDVAVTLMLPRMGVGMGEEERLDRFVAGGVGYNSLMDEGNHHPKVPTVIDVIVKWITRM